MRLLPYLILCVWVYTSAIVGHVRGADSDPILKKGFASLMAKQGEDGGWHSDIYGAMKGGAGLTSLVLYTAAQLPEEIVEPHLPALKRGWAFLAPGIRGVGKVSAPDGESDFPTYSAGLLLTALNELELGETPEDVEALIVYLCRLQLDETHGFEEGDIDYGGWDLMGDAERDGFTMGSSISVTRFAIEGLAPHNKREDVAAALKLVSRWAQNVQNMDTDGGFYFHPDVGHLGNKAGWSDDAAKQPRSYGTATADGIAILSLIEGDAEPSDRLKAAIGWIEKNPKVETVPGFEFDPPEAGWPEGLKYYYLLGLSDILPVLPDDSDKKASAIAGLIQKWQVEDGSWKNASSRMREDDPIIASSFALAALGRLAER